MSLRGILHHFVGSFFHGKKGSDSSSSGTHSVVPESRVNEFSSWLDSSRGLQFFDISWVQNPPEGQQFHLIAGATGPGPVRGYAGATGVWSSYSPTEPQGSPYSPTEPQGSLIIHNCTSNLGEPDLQGEPLNRYQIAKNRFPTNRYTIAKNQLTNSKNCS